MKPKYFGYIFLLFFFSHCRDSALPKPKALLRLEYPQAEYKSTDLNCAYAFDRNTRAVVKENNHCSLVLEYPLMKATIYLTYKKVDRNLRNLLMDAQKLTYDHLVKADRIAAKEYVNPAEQVYGMLYEISGDAASQSQFYVTDSLRHFVTGSLYFYARPNYDSLLPAAVYVQNDMKRIVESLHWKR